MFRNFKLGSFLDCFGVTKVVIVKFEDFTAVKIQVELLRISMSWTSEQMVSYQLYLHSPNTPSWRHNLDLKFLTDTYLDTIKRIIMVLTINFNIRTFFGPIESQLFYWRFKPFFLSHNGRPESRRQSQLLPNCSRASGCLSIRAEFCFW
jgi:hypothetical protein